MFAESTPSLKNLRPMPGEVVFVPVSGSTARENLARPCLAPLNIPPLHSANPPHTVDRPDPGFP